VAVDAQGDGSLWPSDLLGIQTAAENPARDSVANALPLLDALEASTPERFQNRPLRRFSPALPGPDERTHFGERLAAGPTEESVIPQAHPDALLENNPMINQPGLAPAMKVPAPPTASRTAGPTALLKVKDNFSLPDLKTFQLPLPAL